MTAAEWVEANLADLPPLTEATISTVAATLATEASA